MWITLKQLTVRSYPATLSQVSKQEHAATNPRRPLEWQKACRPYTTPCFQTLRPPSTGIGMFGERAAKPRKKRCKEWSKPRIVKEHLRTAAKTISSRLNRIPPRNFQHRQAHNRKCAPKMQALDLIGIFIVWGWGSVYCYGEVMTCNNFPG